MPQPARRAKSGIVVVALWLGLLGLTACIPNPPVTVPLNLEADSGDLPETVWARDSAHLILAENDTLPLALMTRLEVLGSDDGKLVVQCGVCPDAATGTVSWDEVITETLYPQVAAWGDLGDFALAVRAAAERRDLRALLPVMAPTFSYSFVGIQDPESAFAVWRSEDFAALDLAVQILDQGLTTRDEEIWTAPPNFNEQLTYRGMRIGFRKGRSGRWEWLYLISGITP